MDCACGLWLFLLLLSHEKLKNSHVLHHDYVVHWMWSPWLYAIWETRFKIFPVWIGIADHSNAGFNLDKKMGSDGDGISNIISCCSRTVPLVTTDHYFYRNSPLIINCSLIDKIINNRSTVSCFYTIHLRSCLASC